LWIDVGAVVVCVGDGEVVVHSTLKDWEKSIPEAPAVGYSVTPSTYEPSASTIGSLKLAVFATAKLAEIPPPSGVAQLTVTLFAG